MIAADIVESKTRMTIAEISAYLPELNIKLQKASKLPLTDAQLQGYPEILHFLGFTWEHIPAAEAYLLGGVRTSFKTNLQQVEFFFPTETMMQQFKTQFVTSETCEARINEERRRKAAALAVSAKAYRELLAKCNDALAKIEVLEGRLAAEEPATFSADTRKMVEDYKLILNDSVPTLKADNVRLQLEVKSLNRQLERKDDTVFSHCKEIVDLKTQIVALKREFMKTNPAIQLTKEEILFEKQMDDAKNAEKSNAKKVTHGDFTKMSAITQFLPKK